MVNFSIIVPVYNVEGYVGSAIQSVLDQNYDSFEIVLVDDRSTDGSGAICDAYAEKDNRIRVIHEAENGYVGKARNDGFDIAVGRYVYFLDSDDTMCEGVLNRVDKLLDKDFDVISSFKHSTKTYKNGYKVNTAKKFQPLNTAIAAFSPFVGQSFYKREYLLDGARFDEHRMLAEDRKWIVENLAGVSSIIAEDYPFYHYTQRRNGSLLNVIRADYLSYSLGEMKKLFDGLDFMEYANNGRLKRKIADHYLTLAACCAIVKDGELRDKLLSEVKRDIYVLKSKHCLAHPFMWLEKIIGLKNLLKICNAVFLRYKTDK